MACTSILEDCKLRAPCRPAEPPVLGCSRVPGNASSREVRLVSLAVPALTNVGAA